MIDGTKLYNFIYIILMTSIESLRETLTPEEIEVLPEHLAKAYEHSFERAWNNTMICYNSKTDEHGYPESVERRAIQALLAMRKT